MRSIEAESVEGEQEPTRGLVEGFKGQAVQDIKLGVTSSYIQIKQGGACIPCPAFLFLEYRLSYVPVADRCSSG